MKTPPLPTPRKALAAAITAAVAEPTGERLTEAQFNRYAGRGAGWGFTLYFDRQVRETGSRPQEPDSLARRIDLIIEGWERDKARYEEADAQMKHDERKAD